MIKVEGTGHNFIKVQIEGGLDILKIELQALLKAFIESPELETTYLDVSTEIAKRQVEELEKQLKELRND